MCCSVSLFWSLKHSDMTRVTHLRSAASSALAIPATLRSTIGACASVVAAAFVWNKLPQEIRSATSLPVFRRRLKTHLFNSWIKEVLLRRGGEGRENWKGGRGRERKEGSGKKGGAGRKGGRGGKRRGEEEREGETRHTNPSLLPAPLPTHEPVMMLCLLWCTNQRGHSVTACRVWVAGKTVWSTCLCCPAARHHYSLVGTHCTSLITHWSWVVSCHDAVVTLLW